MKLKINDLFPSTTLIIIAVLFVIGKVVTGHNIFLIFFLLISCYGILKEKIEGKIFYLLFFSSWIYVLKFNASGFSLFHLLQFFYLFSFLFSLMIDKNKVNFKIILGFLIFVFYILFNSILISGGGISTVFGFLLNFTTVALALATLQKSEYFKRYVLYYASGLAISGIVALLGNWLPVAKEQIQNMGESYTVYQNNQLFIRFSGLDIDPNYFSFQVLFAIALLLITSHYKSRNLKEYTLILLLVFMGIHTLSKMFLLLLLSIAMFTFIIYAKYKLASAIKYVLAVGVILLAAMPIGLFDFINATLFRFSGTGNSAVSITTGRSDLWLSYAAEIFSNPRVFLIGNGIGTNFLKGFAAHNMYLSYWYFTGLFGVLALLLFIFNSNRQLSKQIDVEKKNFQLGLNQLPLIVLILANCALDSILMDFFPLLLFLTILAGNNLVEQKEASVLIAPTVRLPLEKEQIVEALVLEKRR